eukprot:1149165-Pelagomonas_calceolata.AAC.2
MGEKRIGVPRTHTHTHNHNTSEPVQQPAGMPAHMHMHAQALCRHHAERLPTWEAVCSVMWP